VGAAGLIVQEAGGVVTNWAGGDDWLFSNKVIAGNRFMHDAIQKVLETYIPTEVLHSPTMDGTY
jgi:myo-inositol-1(or 4)-monophosphatase